MIFYERKHFYRYLVSKIYRTIIYEFRLLKWNILGKWHKTVTVSTDQGEFTVFCADKGLGRPIYCTHEFENEWTSKAIKHLRDLNIIPPKGYGTIADIGANMGYISISLIHRGDFGKAIAIEPDPNNFQLLLQNVRQNQLENRFVCLPKAVSDRNAIVQFELSDTNYGDHRVRLYSPAVNSSDLFQESNRKVIEVECQRLDDLMETIPRNFTDNISLVWVDVQGYEGYVFMGAKELLTKGIPVVAEISPYVIKRAGHDIETYSDIAKRFWSSYWVMRRGKFVKYPIAMLDTFFDEVGYEGDWDNVIFTQ